MRKLLLTLVVIAAGTLSGLAIAGGGGGADGLAAHAEPASAGGTFGNLDLTIYTDEAACATGLLQCTQSGGTNAAAGPTNRNPVRVAVQVLSNGVPVTNVPTANVSVSTRLTVPSATNIIRSTCAACFASAGNGVYQIFVQPVSGNWKSGSYFLQATVTNPNSNAKTLALLRVDIPF